MQPTFKWLLDILPHRPFFFLLKTSLRQLLVVGRLVTNAKRDATAAGKDGPSPDALMAFLFCLFFFFILSNFQFFFCLSGCIFFPLLSLFFSFSRLVFFFRENWTTWIVAERCPLKRKKRVERSLSLSLSLSLYPSKNIDRCCEELRGPPTDS